MAVIAACGIVIAIGSALMSASAGKAAAQAQLTVAKANADAGNITRAADNEYKGAAAALTNFSRAQQNKRVLEAAGDQYNVFSKNIVRTMDDSVSKSAYRQLQASEALGTIASAVGAAGVGGGSIDAINSTFRRALEINNSREEKKDDIAIGDSIHQQNQIMDNAAAQLDFNQTFANIDYSKNTPGFVAQTNSTAAALLSGIGQTLPYVKMFIDNRAASQMAASLNTSSAGATTK